MKIRIAVTLVVLGLLDIYTYIYRGIDALSNDFVETIDGEPKLTER